MLYSKDTKLPIAMLINSDYVQDYAHISPLLMFSEREGNFHSTPQEGK